MAKSVARTLRITLSDGSLERVIPEGTLSYILGVVIAIHHARLDERWEGGLTVVARANGAYEVKVSGRLGETLYTAPAPTPRSTA